MRRAVLIVLVMLGCSSGNGGNALDASSRLRFGDEGRGLVNLAGDGDGDGAAAMLDGSTEPDASGASDASGQDGAAAMLDGSTEPDASGASDASEQDGAAAMLDGSTEPDASAPDSCSTREREECDARQCVSVCHNCVSSTGATSSVPLCCESSACALFRSPGCDCQ